MEIQGQKKRVDTVEAKLDNITEKELLEQFEDTLKTHRDHFAQFGLAWGFGDESTMAGYPEVWEKWLNSR